MIQGVAASLSGGDLDRAGLLLERMKGILEKALALYRGHFLPCEEGAWVLFLRKRLLASFLRYTSLMGSYREGEGEWEQATACYNAALEMEEPGGEFQRRLERCFRMIGGRGEA